MDRNLSDRRKRGDATGSRHRRWLSALAFVVTAGLILLPVALLAVHDLAFQLDGDVASSPDGTVGGGDQPIDWADLFDASGNTVASLPTGFGHAKLDKDFTSGPNNPPKFPLGQLTTNDPTTYATGSKDTLAISGWQCNFDHNVNSKIDIMNSYAATYTAANGDKILYFGMERNVNSGDANVGFWFLKGNVDCDATAGTGTFTGAHQDGDILIVSAFTGGGKVTEISAYRWCQTPMTTPADPTCAAAAAADPAKVAAGFLPDTKVAGSGDCRDATHDLNDPICAVANTDTITTPWLTAADKVVTHSLPTAQFFEGGINLTKTQLVGCFNEFIGDTRSSQSLTATLFDYAEGVLGGCNAALTTTPSSGGVNYANAVLPGTSVTDTATITVGEASNPTPTGNVTFYICGPLAAAALCSTGGTQVGSPVAITDAGGDATHGDGTATSAAVNTVASPLAPGRYCFRAEWPGDSNYTTGPFVHSGTGNSECFLVRDTSTTTTTQEWVPNDNATVTAGVSTTPVSGTVKFTLYADSTCGQSGGTILYDPAAISVSGTGSATASTSNTSKITATPTVDGGVSWLVVFTPTNSNILTGSQHCEKTVITITN
jgi:hypothetical protein